MKIQLSQIKSCASVTLVSIGVTALLSTVCAYSSYIPAGEVSYQWLWCGWASLVFFTCALLANLLSVKGVHCFHHSVIWGLILMGGIESVWGLRQIYGFATSNHSLYAVTGSFFNPGPYSGYLALVFPVCLNEWLRLSAVKRRTWIEWAGYYFSFGVLLLLICVLPAGMSRSAWLAAIFSGVFVCSAHYSWKSRLGKVWKAHRRKAVVALVLFSLVMIAGSGANQLRPDDTQCHWKKLSGIEEVQRSRALATAFHSSFAGTHLSLLSAGKTLCRTGFPGTRQIEADGRNCINERTESTIARHP